MTNRSDTLVLAEICRRFSDTSISIESVLDVLNTALTADEFRNIIISGIKSYRKETENVNLVKNIHQTIANHKHFTNNTQNASSQINHDHESKNSFKQEVFDIQDLMIDTFQYLDYQSLCHCREVNIQWVKDANVPLSMYSMTWRWITRAIIARCNNNDKYPSHNVNCDTLNVTHHIAKISSLILHYLQSIVIENALNFNLLKLILSANSSTCHVKDIKIRVLLPSQEKDIIHSWYKALDSIYFGKIEVFQFLLYYQYHGDQRVKLSSIINYAMKKDNYKDEWFNYTNHATKTTTWKEKIEQWNEFLQTRFNQRKCKHIGDISFPLVIAGRRKVDRWLNVALHLKTSPKFVQCIKYLFKWYNLGNISCNFLISVNIDFDTIDNGKQNDKKLLQALGDSKNGNWIELTARAMAHVFQTRLRRETYKFNAKDENVHDIQYQFEKHALKETLNVHKSQEENSSTHQYHSKKRFGHIVYDQVMFNDRITLQCMQSFDTDSTQNQIHTLLQIVLKSRYHPE